MSDQEQFQSGEKQCILEVVNNNSMSLGLTLPLRKTIKENNHKWKFQKIKKIMPATDSPRKPDTNNISFQTEELIELSQQQKDNDDDEDKFSVFTHKYKKNQQIYIKKYSIGTKWLNRKQYFASIFVDPTILAKSDIFSLFKAQPPRSLKNQCFFSGSFESGNLLAAYKVDKHEYDLILQNDINSKGNTQWFYFEMKNIPAKTKIKLNIVNMLKSDSLFNYGMQPCVYSSEANRYNQQGWIRSGTAIKYSRNNNKIDGSNRYYYTLTFTISTAYEGDCLKIAHCYPYTYNDLQNFLGQLQKKPGIKSLIKRSSAGITLGKNSIEVLHILEDNPRKKGNRKIIFITARQHPGQTPSSFVCEGFINYILSEEKEAIFLRKNYQLIILPMLNPDGVIVGNYRTNLCGLDLNRRWDGSKIKEAQQSHLTKRYIAETSRNRQVAFLIDLHGHSRKLFSFFYGNSGLQNPLDVRIFPFICSKLGDNHVRFEDSTFVCEQEKRRTARIQLGLKLKIINIFTFETSFFGFINKKRERIHFTMNTFRELGSLLAKSMYTYEKYKQYPQSSQALIVNKFYDELKSKPQLIARGEKNCSGSQSEPQKGEIDDSQFDRLMGDVQYSKQLSPKKKSLKKSQKKEIIMKQITKVSRQLHVMDIARVNSIFPNDILALMPSSYNRKIKQKQMFKKKKESVGVQTQDIPLIKIYDMCKVQQKMEETAKKKITGFKKLSENDALTRSNMFRTIIRPKSSSNTYLEAHSPSKNQIRIRHQSGIQVCRKKQKKIANSGAQTFITFPPQADFLSKTLDCLMINPVYKTELIKKKNNYSTINTMSMSDVEQNKKSSQSFKIGLRALNVETWRIKKKKIQ